MANFKWDAKKKKLTPTKETGSIYESRKKDPNALERSYETMTDEELYAAAEQAGIDPQSTENKKHLISLLKKSEK